jgi:hypothetical protein
MKWITGGAPKATTSKPTPALRPPAIVDPDGHLTAAARARIQHIMAARSLKMGDVMRAMSLDPLNTSIASALKGRRIKDPALIKALGHWIDANSTV